jgi:hypothetical protein
MALMLLAVLCSATRKGEMNNIPDKHNAVCIDTMVHAG